MFKIRDKIEVIERYIKLYPDLDQFAKEEISNEYDRYIDLIKNLETKEDVMEMFQVKIEENERKYEENAFIEALEGSPHEQFMELLECYGMIVFFRDNMIE
ncbi:MAG: hypothetical protein M0Q14_10225 [Tissierellaceae bacterium]|nr:hypothetical protein [Tissierellaceae bacterium]